MTAVGNGEMFMQNMRKLKKPLIEKKRRDRINRSLSQLKAILLHNIHRNGGTQTAKLDKADILEMTVSYITMLQYGQSMVTMATNHHNNTDYLTCAKEAMCFLRDNNNCQYQAHDKTADVSLQLPVQILIPQTNVLTSIQRPYTFQQNKAFKIEPRVTVNELHYLQDAEEYMELFEDTMDADDITPPHSDTSRINESDSSCPNEQGSSFTNEKVKVWRPW